jgi:hypothetical protein
LAACPVGQLIEHGPQTETLGSLQCPPGRGGAELLTCGRESAAHGTNTPVGLLQTSWADAV